MQWVKQKLTDIASFFEDGNWIESKDQSPHGFWLIQTGNVGVVVFRNKDIKRFVSEETFKRLRCTEIYAGDILISRLPDPVGRSCIVPKSDYKMLTAVDCSILRLKKDYDTRYINYLLNSRVSKTQVYRMVTGSSRKRISRKNLGKIELLIPFKDDKPDLIKQRHIADKLNKIFAEVEKGQNQALEAENEIVLFRKSLLRETFSNPKWQQVSFLDLIDNKSDFSLGKIKQKAYQSQGAVAVVDQGKELISGYTDKKELAYTGRLPVIIFGDHTTIVKYVDFPFVQGADGIKVLIPKKEIYPKYLYYSLLNSKPKGGKYARHYKELRKISYTLPFRNDKPDFAEQKHVVSKLDKIFALSEQLNTLFSRQEESFVRLEASALDKSFNLRTQIVPVAKPVSSVVPRMFDIQQAIAHILKRFERGEMVVAKMLYFAQKIYQVPLNIQFSAQNFGPYDKAVKKAVTAGLSSRNKFFAKKGSGNMQVLSLGSNAGKVLKYSNSALARKINYYLDEMMPHFSISSSNAIERLATICKIIEDTKTIDDKMIKRELHKWKPNKFQDAEISRTIAFIKKNKWDIQLVK